MRRDRDRRFSRRHRPRLARFTPSLPRRGSEMVLDLFRYYFRVDIDGCQQIS